MIFSLLVLLVGNQESDILARMNTRATEGATAGYLPDSLCGTCHRDLFESYQMVGMSQSFHAASDAPRIETLGPSFEHEGRIYRIQSQQDKLLFTRHQNDFEGKPINQFQMEIDWVLGSGNRARSYLYQTDWGELYELPLGWYSETQQWAMSPGFDHDTHPGISRRVTRACLFCHNAYPDVEMGSDHPLAPDRFPSQLPHGTGCQRCHGPGADHVRSVLNARPTEEIRSKIVNPARLPPTERDSVCFQCHMLPSISVVGPRRFDRNDYSFRPGESLSDYRVHVEVDNDDFEINHHGYRLWQSQCYQQSGGTLTCISCHNPHQKQKGPSFRAQVAEKCLSCHSLAPEHPLSDCVTCHMPTRRTADVVLATMTDHRIAKGPFDTQALLAARNPRSVTIHDTNIWPFADGPRGLNAERYRFVALARAQSSSAVVSALADVLQITETKDDVPLFELAKGYLNTRQFSSALDQLDRLKAIESPAVINARGVALFGLGRMDDAKKVFEESLAQGPNPDALFNLGLVLWQQGARGPALESVSEAIVLRSNQGRMWLMRARMQRTLGRLEACRDDLIQALALDPDLADAYAMLVPLFVELDQTDQAKRYREIGLRNLPDHPLLTKLK